MIGGKAFSYLISSVLGWEVWRERADHGGNVRIVKKETDVYYATTFPRNVKTIASWQRLSPGGISMNGNVVVSSPIDSPFFSFFQFTNRLARKGRIRKRASNAFTWKFSDRSNVWPRKLDDLRGNVIPLPGPTHHCPWQIGRKVGDRSGTTKFASFAPHLAQVRLADRVS